MDRPAWQTTRISHLDLTLAWAVCGDANTTGKGAITRTAIEAGLPPSIVQKALSRVEAAMGGKFFVEGAKRTGKLTERGKRFIHTSNKLLDVWAEALEVEPVDTNPSARMSQGGHTT